MTSSHSRRSLRLTLIAPSLLLICVPLVSSHPSIAQTLPLSEPLPTLPAIPRLPAPAEARNSLANMTIDSLIDELRTANGNRHRTLVNELVKRGKSAIPSLTKALEINDPLVRYGVITALGKSGDSAIAAVPTLVKLTTDNRRALFPRSEYDYLPSAEIGLPPIGNRNQPPTPPDNPRNLINVAAVAALGQIGPAARRSATEPLSQLLKSDEPWVKLHATWALNQMGAETPILPTYLALLQHPDREVRSSTIQTIENDTLISKVIGAEANPAMIQKIIQTIPQTDNDGKVMLQNWLKMASRDAIPALIETLKSPNPQLRFSAVQTLGVIGPDARYAIPSILPLFNDRSTLNSPSTQSDNKQPIDSETRRRDYSDFPVPPNPRHSIRIEAMIAIARLLNTAEDPDDRPIALTTQLMQDRDPEIKLTAAWLLKQIKGNNRDSLTIYINALTQAELRESAKAISSTFADWGIKISPDWFSAENRRDLLKLINDQDQEIQTTATRLLAQIGAPIVPELITLLQLPNIRTKHAAIDVLKKIGQPANSALPALTALLQDPSSYRNPDWQPWMRTTIMPALLNRDRNTKYYYQVAFPREQDSLIRSEAIDAIGYIGTKNPETLASLTKLAQQDRDHLVKLKATWAAIILGGDEKANMPFLEATLKSADSNLSNTAESILEGIGKPAGSLLISHYLRKLDNPEERTNAVVWFGNNRLGALSLEAVPKIRPYLEGSDRTLRGYTITILANIADGIIEDAKNNQLSDRALKTAIDEYVKINKITQKQDSGFNVEPVDRLRISLAWLKQYQAKR